VLNNYRDVVNRLLRKRQVVPSQSTGNQSYMSVRTESIQRRLRIEGRVPEEITVLFRPSEESVAFHCPTCGTFQFYRKHRIIALVEDDMSQILAVPPISPVCRKCGTVFHIYVL